MKAVIAVIFVISLINHHVHAQNATNQTDDETIKLYNNLKECRFDITDVLSVDAFKTEVDPATIPFDERCFVYCDFYVYLPKQFPEVLGYLSNEEPTNGTRDCADHIKNEEPQYCERFEPMMHHLMCEGLCLLKVAVEQDRLEPLEVVESLGALEVARREKQCPLVGRRHHHGDGCNGMRRKIRCLEAKYGQGDLLRKHLKRVKEAHIRKVHHKKL